MCVCTCVSLHACVCACVCTAFVCICVIGCDKWLVYCDGAKLSVYLKLSCLAREHFFKNMIVLGESRGLGEGVINLSFVLHVAAVLLSDTCYMCLYLKFVPQQICLIS